MSIDLLDHVLVPVPAQHAERFIRIRDRISSGEIDAETLIEDDSSEPAHTGVEIPGQGVWTQAMINKLRDRLAYPLVLRLIETSVERPNEWIPKAEIDAHSQSGQFQFRNELSAFSQLTKRLFDHATWPFEHNSDSRGVRYRVPVAIADMWKASAK